MRMLRTVLVTTLTVAHVAEGFGTGGADSGVGQSCKAIDLCPLRAWSATDVVRICPDGMTSVGAAQTGNVDPMDPNSARQEIYTLRSGDAQPFKTNAASDPKTYSPGKITTIHIRVNNKFIHARRKYEDYPGMFACFQSLTIHDVDICHSGGPNRGGVPHSNTATDSRLIYSSMPYDKQIKFFESAKYIGLLLYAVDAQEKMVGSWEIPAETPPVFWTPPDPGCDGKAIMQADPTPKRYHEEFAFRAPPAGTGPITFRALIKQGDTNGGAFYWPLAPAMADPSKDLTLTEGADVNAGPGWFKATAFSQSCHQVCDAESRLCDQTKFNIGTSVPSFLENTVEHVNCKQPILSSCDAAAPTIAASGSGTCWFYDTNCANLTSTATCGDYSDTGQLRLCPCKAVTTRRRRLGEQTAHSAAAAAANTTNAGAKSSKHGVLAFSVPLLLASQLSGTRGGGIGGGVAAAALLLLSGPWMRAASAHNYLYNPAHRARQASTVKPCRARDDMTPGVQMNPGDEFPIEYAVGHPDFKVRAYFTVVKSKHEKNLGLLTNSLLDDYINNQPLQSGSVACGDHRAATCAECKANKCKGECAMSGAVCALDPTNAHRNDNPLWEDNFYQAAKYDKMHQSYYSASTFNDPVKKAEQDAKTASYGRVKVEPGSPLHIHRPNDFKCRYPREESHPYFGEHCVGKPTQQWSHTAEKKVEDSRAAYNSSKYPWILSVGAYRIVGNQKYMDSALVKIPAIHGHGEYIVQYHWGGYNDCIDVAVLPLINGVKQVPEIAPANDHFKFGFISNLTTLARVDHCQYVSRTLYQINRSMFPIPGYQNGNIVNPALPGVNGGCANPNICYQSKQIMNPNDGGTELPEAKRSVAGCIEHCQATNKHRFALMDNMKTCFCGTSAVASDSQIWGHGQVFQMGFAVSCDEQGQIPFQTCFAIPPPGLRNSKNQTREVAVESCKTRCVGYKTVMAEEGYIVPVCEGVNIVPIEPPPKVSLSVGNPSGVTMSGRGESVDLGAGTNIPWGVGNCDKGCFENEPAGTSMCYGLYKFGSREVEEVFITSPRDIFDEIWYSTCYRQSRIRLMKGVKCKPPVCVPPEMKEWRFADSCISCDNMKANSKPGITPHWVIAPQNECIACFPPLFDGPVFRAPAVGQIVGGWASPDGAMNMQYVLAEGGKGVTFTVTCASCQTATSWVAVGINPSGSMSGTSGVRCNFADSSVSEIQIAGYSANSIAKSSAASKLSAVSVDPAKKTFTFTTHELGSHKVALSGTQMWVMAYANGLVATKHDARYNNQNLDFKLVDDTSAPTKAPGLAPTYPTAAPTETSSPTSAPSKGPTQSGVTYAPTIPTTNVPTAQPTIPMIVVESTIGIRGTTKAKFEGSNAKAKFKAAMTKFATDLVGETVTCTISKISDTNAARRRRLQAAGISVAFSLAPVPATFAVGEFTSKLSTFLTDTTEHGFASKAQVGEVEIISAPASAMVATPGGAGEGSKKPDAIVVVILAAVGVNGVLLIVVASTILAVVAVVMKRRADFHKDGMNTGKTMEKEGVELSDTIEMMKSVERRNSLNPVHSSIRVKSSPAIPPKPELPTKRELPAKPKLPTLPKQKKLPTLPTLEIDPVAQPKLPTLPTLEIDPVLPTTVASESTLDFLEVMGPSKKLPLGASIPVPDSPNPMPRRGSQKLPRPPSVSIRANRLDGTGAKVPDAIML